MASRSSGRTDIHPVYVMATVGTIVGMLGILFGVEPLFSRPAAGIAAAVTWLVFWLRSRTNATHQN